ncbi:hypothetical protein IFM51744_10460 [Aspergillus udagawae]|nr:hypothetical protein IFM51744_10460 [Aspergillus udagawae]GFG19959.1 hypothetical protein IFM5058_10399 [Aspergillus udagawae]
MAAFDSVGLADFKALVFNEIALGLFHALCEKHNPKDGDENSRHQFCSAARSWLTFSVKYKFRQLTEAIIRIPGMEHLSFQEVVVKAAVVGWDDLFQEWLQREKNLLRDDGQRYRFAQHLGLSLRYNSSLSFSQIEILLREIRSNSVALRRHDGKLSGGLNSIVKQIQTTRARDESADISSFVRALNNVSVIVPSNEQIK